MQRWESTRQKQKFEIPAVYPEGGWENANCFLEF